MDKFNKLKFSVFFGDVFLFYSRALNKSYDDFKGDFVNRFYPNFSFDETLQDIIEKSNIDDVHSIENSYLSSVFSKISLESTNKNKKYFVPLTPLYLNESMYPDENLDSSQLNFSDYWEEFISEMELISNLNDFKTVFALSKKFFSTICYHDDISLHDHLKTTCAIANCLYSTDEDNNNPFVVINGDISGIQKFIYKVSSPENAQKSMSKRLRGRSLYLTLLTESICEKIISDLSLDSTNILFCGGGRFTIIAPNVKRTHDEIKYIDEYVNNIFIEKFNAELYLILVKKELSFENLHDFGSVLSNLSSDITENKKHKFFNQIEDLFKIKESTKQNLCVVCGNEMDNGDFCNECNNHANLGKNVANSQYLIVYEGEGYSEFSIFGRNYIFAKTKDDAVKFIEHNVNEHCTIYSINSTDFLDLVREIDNKLVSFDFKFIGNNVPNIYGNPLYFEHLANLSKGANKLGVLKMDVDNLGKIFSQGFNKNDCESNIYRISSLSFNLDLFFSGMINDIVNNFKVYSSCGNFRDYFEKNTKKLIFNENDESYSKEVFIPKRDKDVPKELDEFATSTIYINYSGGDDLLVLGPYDDIIEFALEFRTRFKEWTSYNSSINISAGVSLFNSKFPIGKAAIIADGYLEQSKECGRDKITIFNQTLSWTDEGQILGFQKLFDFAKELEELTEKGKLSNGFTYSLMKLWESNNDLGELTRFTDEDWHDYNCVKANTHSYVPKYYYKLRLVDKEYRDYLASKFEYIPWIKMPVSWVSLRLRG